MILSFLKRLNIKFKEFYYKRKYPGIHKSVRIGYDTLIQCSELTIGEHSYIQRHCSLTGDIEIGLRCSIASGVNIRGEKHISPLEGKKGEIKDIVICNDVVIGCGAFIKEGVTIGDDCVVGANSVVTKNIPKGQVWAGNPARRIK